MSIAVTTRLKPNRDPAAAKSSLRVGLIGAGAVSRIFYLPVFRKGLPGLELTMVADQSAEAIERLGALPRGTQSAVGSFHDVLSAQAKNLDAVIIALPHHLHAAGVTAALEQCMHVFCEKPLGLDEFETRAMLNLAEKRKRVLAVCQPRRSAPAANAIQRLLQLGWLGNVKRVDWEEGQPYSWPAESLSLVRRETGGEEIFDIGAHVLDLLCWWLGPLQLQDYADDSRGGAGAEFQLRLRTQSDAEVHVKLSRLYHQKNQVAITCSRGRIVWSVHNPDALQIDSPDLDPAWAPTVSLGGCDRDWPLAAFRDQLQRFAAAVLHGAEPAATAHDAIQYAELFSAIRLRQERPAHSLRVVPDQKLQVVTGAAGFIGCRLVERLLERSSPVRSLVHRPQSCVRLARLPVNMELCDVRNAACVQESMRGADVVFHCAGSAASDRATIVDGTIHVLQAAEAQGVRRAIVFSSMLAYGDPPAQGIIDESSTGTASGQVYGAAKREMEMRCLEFARSSRVDVVILEPTCVYGPFAPDFVAGPLESMLAGTFFQMECGAGRANLVHVDNLIDAAFLATEHPRARGQRYLINEDEWPSTWADFFGQLSSEVLGRPLADYPSLTLSELKSIIQQRARDRQFPAVVKRALLADPLARDWLVAAWWFRALSAVKQRLKRDNSRLQTTATAPANETVAPVCSNVDLRSRLLAAQKLFFDEASGRFFSSQAIYSSTKIRRDLGWKPSLSRDEGMLQTMRWAKQVVASRLHGGGQS